MPTIITIVEGPGDVSAFPDLMYRIIVDLHNRPDILVAQGKSSVVCANSRQNIETKLEKFLKHALNKPKCDAILVLLDADNDCPVDLGKKLTKRCRNIGIDCPIEVVCAHRSYESWFLASLESVKGRGIIPITATLERDPEAIPSPKHWITSQLSTGMAYKETTHQATLSKLIDLHLARANSRSFRRLCHAVEVIVKALG